MAVNLVEAEERLSEAEFQSEAIVKRATSGLSSDGIRERIALLKRAHAELEAAEADYERARRKELIGAVTSLGDLIKKEWG